MIRRLAWLVLVATTAACQESSEFTPVSPSEFSKRIEKELAESSKATSYAVPGSRTFQLFPFNVYDNQGHQGTLLVDWQSPANNITVAIHRTGDAGPIDSGIFSPYDCSVPVILAFGGSPIGAPLSRPLCPVVKSNVTTDKPKALELGLLPSGMYSLVFTNSGGPDTMRTVPVF